MRAAAARALGLVGYAAAEHGEQLAEALEDEDWLVRAEAARALEQTHSVQSGAAALAERLSDPDWDVRCAAAAALRTQRRLEHEVKKEMATRGGQGQSGKENSSHMEDRLAELHMADSSLGAKRLHELLREEGFSVSEKKVRELLMEGRLAELHMADSSLGAKRLYELLQGEGFSVSEKKVRELLKEEVEKEIRVADEALKRLGEDDYKRRIAAVPGF